MAIHFPVRRDNAFDGTPGTVFALEFAGPSRIHFECTAARGGLITVFACNGRNVLIGPEVNPDCSGSTFWTSPQADWDWPPPPGMDDCDWTARVDEPAGIIELSGPEIAGLALRIRKRYAPLPSGDGVRIDYTIENRATVSRPVAHWEISRVAPGGLTFYPQGEGSPGCADRLPLPVFTQDRITWFQHDQRVTGQHKLFSDGAEGWIAHLSDDLLFIKSFRDEPASAAAPGEAEIEIYATPEYVEVEQQGPFMTLSPGEQRTWSVEWRILPVDPAAQKDFGALAALARQMIALD